MPPAAAIVIISTNSCITSTGLKDPGAPGGRLGLDKHSDAEDVNQKVERRLSKTLIGILAAAVLGLLLIALLPGIGHERPGLPALAFGAVFGGWIGLFSCACFNYLAKIRQYGIRTRFRMIFIFAILGGLSGGMALFWFGDGLAMAFGLALEGAAFGVVIGVVLSVLILVTEHN